MFSKIVKHNGGLVKMNKNLNGSSIIKIYNLHRRVLKKNITLVKILTLTHFFNVILNKKIGRKKKKSLLDRLDKKKTRLYGRDIKK